jgi:hypothetical protein
MRIRLLTTPAHRYGAGWPPVGETMEVPEGLGAYMIANGEAAAVLETAEVSPPENAAVRTSKPAPRKR